MTLSLVRGVGLRTVIGGASLVEKKTAKSVLTTDWNRDFFVTPVGRTCWMSSEQSLSIIIVKEVLCPLPVFAAA
jgi:hypothetical protein